MEERTMAQNGTIEVARTGLNNGNTFSDYTRATTYVSPSRLKTWLSCPLKYKLRYVDGIVTPTSPNLFLGQVVHRGLEFYYRHRQRGVRLYPEFVGEHIKNTWGRAVDDELITFECSDEERQLQAKAIELVSTYIAQVADDEPSPIAIEERFEAPLIDPRSGEDLGISLVGIIDLVLDEGKGPVICDFKTAARSSSHLDLMHELQLSCYSYLFRKVTGKIEDGLEIRSLVKTKTPRIEVHRFGPRHAIHFERLFDVIRAYLDAVSSNRYHISPGFECSFCDFRETCAGTVGI